MPSKKPSAPWRYTSLAQSSETTVVSTKIGGFKASQPVCCLSDLST